MPRMPAPALPRRALIGLPVAALAGAFSPRIARALDAPEGKPLLTLNGHIANPNDEGRASFDLTMLQRMPAHTFSTRTPWYGQPRKFTGVALQDLLDAAGAAEPTTVKAIALNDYRVDIPIEDFTRHGAMLAYLLDGRPMSVREKGPVVVIYPFDDNPELRNAVHYSRAIWQLRSLDLK
jgi:hypothetical protein